MMSPMTKPSWPATRMSQGSQPDGRWIRMPRKPRATMARPHASYTADCSPEPWGRAKNAAMNIAPIAAAPIQACWRSFMWRESSPPAGELRTPRTYLGEWPERPPSVEVGRQQLHRHERDRGDAARAGVVRERERDGAQG